MSAFGTKKVGGDYGLQLTFPSVFENQYKEDGTNARYLGGLPQTAQFDYVGDDLQSEWHEQKRQDAHRMANAKVQSTINHNIRANNSHNGFYGMPKAVLGQRKIGQPIDGTQSYGNDVYGDARRRLEGLSGGVLRSKEGQEYGRKILQRRADWYNAIDSALEGKPTAPPNESIDTLQPTELIELNTQIDSLTSMIMTNDLSRVSVETMVRIMKLLFRYVPTITDFNDFDEVYDRVSTLSGLAGNLLEDYTADYVEDPEEDTLANAGYIETISNIASRLEEYMRIMGDRATFDVSYKDRLTASKSAIKSLAFNKIPSVPREVLSVQQQQRAVNEGYAPIADGAEGADGAGRTETDLEGGRRRRKRMGKIDHSDEKLLAMNGREAQNKMILKSMKTPKGQFTKKPLKREVSERLAEGQSLGDGRNLLTTDERENYGEKSGEFYDMYAEGKGEVAQAGGKLPKDRLRLISKRK
jgi:hypothetical protein